MVHANVDDGDDEWFRKIIRKRMPRKALTWKIAFFDRRLIGRWGFLDVLPMNLVGAVGSLIR